MKKSIVAALLSAVLVAASPANASPTSYLSITGKASGQLKGSVTQKGREGRIAVIAAEHRVQNNAGKKQHGLFVVTKEIDRTSPILYKIMATAEVLSDFDLQYLEVSKTTGTEQLHYRVKLTNARIASIKLTMPNVRNPDSIKTELEEVSFTYDTIAWTYDSATTSDSASGAVKGA